MAKPHPVLEEVIAVLSDFRRSASLSEIYHAIQSRDILDLSAYKDWKASVRAAIETHSSDSPIWRGHLDIFYKDKAGRRRGVWGLRADCAVRRPCHNIGVEDVPSSLAN